MAEDSPLRRSARRYPAIFNGVTGLSERRPYNVVDLSWPRFWPEILQRLLFFVWLPLRWIAAFSNFVDAWLASLFYYWPLHFWEQKYRLNETEAELLGHKASGYVRSLLRRKAGSQVRDQEGRRKSVLQVIQDLKRGIDMSYVVLRGMPTVTPFFRFPEDHEFPERDRDSESLDARIKGVSAIPPAEHEELTTERQEEKRKKLDLAFTHPDFLVAGLADLLDCKVQGRNENAPLAGNLLSTPNEQQSSDLDNADMPLRFHQSAVEKVLPERQLVHGEGPVYRAYLCVKNLLRIPVYLITVQDIVDRYLCPYDENEKIATLKLLEGQEFIRRGPRYSAYQSLQPLRSTEKNRVLRRGYLRDGDWIMLYDHERVRPMSDAQNLENALAQLREAIRRARRDAIRIVLRPGDVLIVDNLRAMVSRREYFPFRFFDLVRLLPALFVQSRKVKINAPDDPGATIRLVKSRPWRPHRWLRAYYFFRAKATPADEPSPRA